MKTMMCSQLGGICEKKFHGKTFKEVAIQIREHTSEMVDQGDIPHKLAAQDMTDIILKTPQSAQEWFTNKMEEFANLPDN